MWGAGRATVQVFSAAMYVNLHMMNHPQIPVRIFENPNLFDKDGNLVDEKLKEQYKKLAEGLIAWSLRLQKK
jgi:hypothetical protein